jgi:hypothetical protein
MCHTTYVNPADFHTEIDIIGMQTEKKGLPDMWHSIGEKMPSCVLTLAMHVLLACILAYQRKLLPAVKDHHLLLPHYQALAYTLNQHIQYPLV